jgi:hypothetical protein
MEWSMSSALRLASSLTGSFTVSYQEQVIKRVKLATYQLSTPQGYQLTRRPFQVSWFLNQLAMYVCIYINSGY